MLRLYVVMQLNPKQFRGLALGQWLEALASPEGGSPHQRIDQPSPDAGLAGEHLDVELGREESVGSAFHHEALRTLADDHAARAPARVEHDRVHPGARQLPGRRHPGDTGPRYRDGHSHARAAAVLCASSARAATSSGSSFSDAVRSNCTPSPSSAASLRYTMSTSYRIST